MLSWTTPTFAAGSYTASGAMTWTVASGNVTTSRYSVLGNTITMAFYVSPTTVAGVLNTELRIVIPESKVATGYSAASLFYLDNGTLGIGVALVQTSDTFVRLYKASAANWQASVGNTGVFGEIVIEFT